MLLDIFSIFDPHRGRSAIASYIVWTLVVITISSVAITLWQRDRSFRSLLKRVIRVSESLVKQTLRKELGGTVSLFSALILTLIYINFMGLVPYVFRTTRHMALNFRISLPIWLAVVTSGLLFNHKLFLAHFQPAGSPTFLSPLLCLIELVSNLVRPLTLAVRLTANLRTGHILMTLIGVGFIGTSSTGGILILSLGAFYFIFEIVISIIQAYIFTLLPTLYMDDHPRDNH